MKDVLYAALGVLAIVGVTVGVGEAALFGYQPGQGGPKAAVASASR